MEGASQHPQRGSIADIDLESTAHLLGLVPEKITVAIDVWREKNRIDAQNRIVMWDRQQGTSTHRVRAHRARLREDEQRARLREEEQRQKARAASMKAPPHPDSDAAIAARRSRLQDMQGRRPPHPLTRHSRLKKPPARPY